MTSFEDQNSPQAEFVGLLTECQLSLLLYIRSLMPGDHRAADVAQQANAKIWELRDDFEIGTNFRAWAFAIARFEVLNHRKRQARDARLVFSEDLEKTMAAELETFNDNFLFRHEALRHCLNTLKPESRQLLMDRYTSQDSLTAFADRIGRPAGSVKVSLHRLRTAIGDCIERRLLSMENSK